LEEILSKAEIWVLAAASDQLGEIDKLLAPYLHAPRWFTQPAIPGSFQLRSSVVIDPPDVSSLAVQLSRNATALEIVHQDTESSLFMFHTGLGIKRVLLDGAGEVVMRAGQIERLMTLAAGNMREFQRLIRLEQGQLWMDVLEPLRRGLVNLDQLPRAV
jgi:hypothetical protein